MGIYNRSGKSPRRCVADDKACANYEWYDQEKRKTRDINIITKDHITEEGITRVMKFMCVDRRPLQPEGTKRQETHESWHDNARLDVVSTNYDKSRTNEYTDTINLKQNTARHDLYQEGMTPKDRLRSETQSMEVSSDTPYTTISARSEKRDDEACYLDTRLHDAEASPLTRDTRGGGKSINGKDRTEGRTISLNDSPPTTEPKGYNEEKDQCPPVHDDRG
jgi:hypothetical protein